MAIILANNANGHLASSITEADTLIPLRTGQGAQFPNPTGGNFFPVTLVRADGQLEICYCTARSGDVLTVTRARENTTAKTFSSGDRVSLRLTTGVMQTIFDVVNPITPFAKTLLDDANASAARATLSAQASDATLTALAGVTTAANKLIYATAPDVFTTTSITPFARTLIDDVDAAAMRDTLGLTDVVLRDEITSAGASISDIAQLPVSLASTAGAGEVNTSNGQSVQEKINEFETLKPYQTAAQVAKTFQSGSRPVISCYGDSTMWGAKVGDLGTQDVNNPPARLATALNLVYSGAGFTVNNRAISGTTLRQMLTGTDGSGSTFISKISAGGVDAAAKIIYCNHCINDSQLNGDVDQYREDLVYFVNACRAAGKVPVLATANPNPALFIINEEKSKRLYYYVETMRDVAKKTGCDLVDQFMYFEASTKYIRIDQIVPDGAHLSTDAYKQAGFNLAIPLVCCRTIGEYGDSAGLENTTYFDNLSTNRQIQYRGAKTGGTLTADRPASGLEGVNYPVIFSKGQRCFSIIGLQWASAANLTATIDMNFVGLHYMQKQFGDQASLKWDCESKYYGNFFAGLHVVGLLFDATTLGIGNGLTFSGVSIPKLYESSQIGGTAGADPYTKHVIAAGDSVNINSLISSDGYRFCDSSGALVVRIWINAGVLTIYLYKNGAVVQTGTAGSSLTSNVFAPMQLRIDVDKLMLNYGVLGITLPITSPLPNMKGYTALMQYHVAPTFGV